MVNAPSARLLPLLFATAFLALSPGEARGDAADRLPRLARLHADVNAARGPLVFVALRKVGAEWDRGDPAQVEEVLRSVADDTSEPAPARAYAGLLEAYARRR